MTGVAGQPTPSPGAGPEAEAFRQAALAGLTRAPKQMPGKFLWDEAGSILFDRITRHPDYYPTGREMRLLPRAARDIAALVGAHATIVEFGSGASHKIRTLIAALARPRRVVSVDISRAYLVAATQRLAADFPGLDVVPVCADYGAAFTLPLEQEHSQERGPERGAVLGFFPGTSIGNLSPGDAEAFLGRARAALGPSRLLIGADPTQDKARLQAAYGDCDGLMPAFHLNLLARMNRELGTGFAADGFRHALRFPDDPFRVEAHLVAARAQRVRLGSATITFAAGESLRTDTSHKYPPAAFRALAERGGWRVERTWLDADAAFALYLLASADAPPAAAARA